MYHEIFKTLVIELKLVDYEYFMDKMQEYEVYMFYDNLKYTDRPEWEQTRLIMYILAQTNSKKKLEITDLIKFPWDSEGGESETIEDTTENRNSLREKAKQFEKILQTQK